MSGTLPTSGTGLGQTVPVKSWRVVLSASLGTLAGTEPAKFVKVLDKYPHYIAASPQGFRGPKPLRNGYYVETCLGAASMHCFCQRAITALVVPPAAWAVQVKPLE